MTYEDVKIEFGSHVADGVLALTKNESLATKEAQMRDSLARIKMQPKEVSVVKLADRMTNMSAPPAYWKNEKRINIIFRKYNHKFLDGNTRICKICLVWE